jgi:formate C-acetyltransferase
VLSSTKWCQQRALGGAVHNAKFPKTLVKTAHGRTALKNVITTFLQRGGFEIQVNVVDADVLRKAQAHPEEYADLVVRVAGYSDYFIHLSKIMQDEVITRTEHEL